MTIHYHGLPLTPEVMLLDLAGRHVCISFATKRVPKARGAPVWHLGLPISYLIELAREWPRICFGSSQQYWKVGSPIWKGRMHEAFAALEDEGLQPEIHGLRMMNEAGNWPLASVDSVNIARNYKDRDDMPGRMADRLDRVNAPKIFFPKRTFINVFA